MKENKILDSYSVNQQTVKDLREKAITDLLNDKIINKYLNDNNIDKAFVEDHLVEFMDMANYDHDCLKCKGFSNCTKTPKGFIQIVNKDTAALEYAKCVYYKKLQPLIEGYTMRDFSDDWLTNSIDIVINRSFAPSVKKAFVKVLGHEKNDGIYLYGKTGTGKSYLLACLTNELILGDKVDVCFINFKSFLNNLKNNFDTGTDELINQIKNAKVLVIDDLGSEKPSDWSKYDILLEVLESRLDNNKLTCISSRYSLEELNQLYNKSNLLTRRLIDTINSLMSPVLLDGIDYRKVLGVNK